jgi:hypothetical protein
VHSSLVVVAYAEVGKTMVFTPGLGVTVIVNAGLS